jgi:hypothetical protein
MRIGLGSLSSLRGALRFDFLADLIYSSQHIPFHVLQKFLRVSVTDAARDGPDATPGWSRADSMRRWWKGYINPAFPHYWAAEVAADGSG